MKFLIVVAHPDDEVLGFGAAGSALTDSGHEVQACVLSGSANVRANRPSTEELHADTIAAQRILGFGMPILGVFPNIALNTVPHVELVRFIEDALLASGATHLVTHHPRDLNNDHLHVSRACQASARLWQRREGAQALERLLFMETQSSTDWSFPPAGAPFDPDTFIPVAEEHMERKIRALASYRGVMRPAPHPRSEELVRALASLRGSQCGAHYAEAFMNAYHVLRFGSRD